MTQEVIIEKIKSLLALATGEGNENEKKLALQRAQELMAKYSVDIGEEKEPEILDSLITFEYRLPVYLENQINLGILVNEIGSNFGCWAFMRGKDQIYLMGFKTNLEIAKFAIHVLIRQGIQDFRVGYKKERQIGYSNLFWKGFELGLHQRFTKISNEKALILYDKVKSKWDQMAKLSYNPDSFSGNGLLDGKRSALEAVLNPSIQSQRGNLLS